MLIQYVKELFDFLFREESRLLRTVVGFKDMLFFITKIIKVTDVRKIIANCLKISLINLIYF